MSALQALSLVGQLGLVMAVCVVAGVAVGVFLDNKFHSHGLLLILSIFSGVAAGIVSVYRIVSKQLPWKR